MSDWLNGAGVTIFTGRFGSGKTEAAINYALTLRRKTKDEKPGTANGVILVDLDIVTPYFRTRERAEAMQDRGVKVIAPSVIGQHLDTPAITPQLLGAIQQTERPTVMDVGGDRQGARALGQYSAAIQQRGYTMHFVVNPYRPFTDTLQGLADSIAEIEASARLQVTSLVSNPNLIGETTEEGIIEGHVQIEEFAQALGLPIAFVCIERSWAANLGSNRSAKLPAKAHFAQPVLILERFFVMSWEEPSTRERPR
ncbi:MAG: hypothetical protein PVH17_11305 [Anaerolineae bacterium]|jgi:hypothetical protein